MNKRNLKIVSIFLSIVMCIAMIPMSAMAAGPREIAGDITLENGTSKTDKDSNGDGYTWDHTTNTLTLKNVKFTGKLIFQRGTSDKTINIKVDGDSYIEKIGAVAQTYNYNLSFVVEGPSKLEVNKMFSDVNTEKLEIKENSTVVFNKGISIATTSGYVGASIEVAGKLILDGNTSSEATAVLVENFSILNKGKVTINNFKEGIRLLGKFEIVEGGILESNATDCNLMIYRGSNDPTGNVDNYMVVPANYIPKGYEIKVVEDDNNNYALTIAPKTSNPTLDSESVSGAGGVLEIKEQTPEAPAVPETTKKVENTKKAETTTKKTEVKAENPPTADNTNAVAWAVAALATIGGYSYVSLKRKSEENA